MLPELQQLVAPESDLTVSQIAARLAVAIAFGAAVALVHALFRRGDANPAAGLGSTIVLLTVLVALVTHVIGNSLARAFGLVGALSIVRFRTAVTDTRDTAFVIFAVAEGMAVGAGYFAAAGIAVPVVAAACLVLRLVTWPVGVPGQLKLTAATAADAEAALGAFLGKGILRYRLHCTGSCRKGQAVMVSYNVALAPRTDVAALIDAVRVHPGVLKVTWVGR
jgi:hypothetical protein